DEPHDLALLHVEADVVEHLQPAEAERHVLDGEVAVLGEVKPPAQRAARAPSRFARLRHRSPPPPPPRRGRWRSRWPPPRPRPVPPPTQPMPTRSVRSRRSAARGGGRTRPV